jgi:hypothetical protein
VDEGISEWVDKFGKLALISVQYVFMLFCSMLSGLAHNLIFNDWWVHYITLQTPYQSMAHT